MSVTLREMRGGSGARVSELLFHCQKDELGYWHCNIVHVVGRRPEDAQLERELIDLFPGMLKDVRLVGEGEDDGRRSRM